MGMCLGELSYGHTSHTNSLVSTCAGAAAAAELSSGSLAAAVDSRLLASTTASIKLGSLKISTLFSVSSGTVDPTTCHKKQHMQTRKGRSTEVTGANYCLSLEHGKSCSQLSSLSVKGSVYGFMWQLYSYGEQAASNGHVHVGSKDSPVSTARIQVEQTQTGDFGVRHSDNSASIESRDNLDDGSLTDEDNEDGSDGSLGVNSYHMVGGIVLDEDETSQFGLKERKASGSANDGHRESSPKRAVDETSDGNLAASRPEDHLRNNEGAKKVGETRQKTSYGVLGGETISVAVKEPVYEVLEVTMRGCITKKEISRRQLLKTSGLRLRDIRSVDPSLWVTNSVPALSVRDHAILLNLGSLRSIVTRARVLIFDHRSIGAQNFLGALRQRLAIENTGIPAMPFQLEAVEAALISRTQRLEQTLMQIEPRVVSLLEILPNRLTADVLEELRISKQALVELSSKAGSLRQMLLELLEDPHQMRRMTIIGRSCHIRKEDDMVECLTHLDKQVAEDEEEEIEMLLENYLQRCESCHGQAQKLLDSAKEMEDSISVNLSARRLEVSRLELLLQVGTFCTAIGALIAGIFGMNLRSYLEENLLAFWITTAGIIFGGLALFILMYTYLTRRRIL